MTHLLTTRPRPHPSEIKNPFTKTSAASATKKMKIHSTLQDLQTEEQGRVLDTVSQIRKCGLDSILSLPQIVVCGDQSAGKSSVLEALTEIPFPRSDNLCTRFATEISLRREEVETLTVRVIPDSSRPQEEQSIIKDYAQTITDFNELPSIIENAKEIMGISDKNNAFAEDVLSIEICGPQRPQLTLVDIPGLIQASTKGVSESDVTMVGKITDRYIEQTRTICLAVISATNDAANQPILDKVRKYDPCGDRTLGIITKLDKLDAGSGTEDKFLELARNQDVFFKLGWHAIKNRNFEERDFSFEKRNQAEEAFFKTSTFSCLPKDHVGIGALRRRLSQLLFEHVKNELPRLQQDLETALKTHRTALQKLGNSRCSPRECRTFLVRFSTECYQLTKAALDGNYEHKYFANSAGSLYLKKLRAEIQTQNQVFAETMRVAGHKFIIIEPGQASPKQPSQLVVEVGGREFRPENVRLPTSLSRSDASRWVRNRLSEARGTELVGNFNPRIIAELFREQSVKWKTLAESHTQVVHKACETFLVTLVNSQAPPDLHSRLR